MNNKKKYDVLIFDLDGTLINSKDNFIKCAIQTYKAMKLTPPTKESIDCVFEEGLIALEELLNNPKFGLADKSTSIKDEWLEYFNNSGRTYPVYDGVIETLNEIKKNANIPMVMMTNNSEQTTHIKLKNNALKDYFDDIICCDAPNTMAKPCIDMMTILHKRKPHYDCKNALMIGDTLADIGFAKNCDIPIAWCKYGYSCEQHCLPIHHKHMVLTKPKDLLKFVL